MCEVAQQVVGACAVRHRIGIAQFAERAIGVGHQCAQSRWCSEWIALHVVDVEGKIAGVVVALDAFVGAEAAAIDAAQQGVKLLEWLHPRVEWQIFRIDASDVAVICCRHEKRWASRTGDHHR